MLLQMTYKIMDKTYEQFLRWGTLGSPIEFKHMVALINET